MAHLWFMIFKFLLTFYLKHPTLVYHAGKQMESVAYGLKTPLPTSYFCNSHYKPCFWSSTPSFHKKDHWGNWKCVLKEKILWSSMIKLAFYCLLVVIFCIYCSMMSCYQLIGQLNMVASISTRALWISDQFPQVMKGKIDCSLNGLIYIVV